ncbi:MAG: PKD domain-containing protein [Phycisphaerae bacterium]
MVYRPKFSTCVPLIAALGTLSICGCGVVDLSGLLDGLLGGEDDPNLLDPNIDDGSENNTKPLASAGSDLTVTAGDEVVFDASLTGDVDGDRLTYSWVQTDGSPRVQLTNAFSSAPRFFAPELDEATTITFQLIVSDRFSTASDEVTVTINP